MKQQDKKSLNISIGKLWNSGEGENYIQDIDSELEFDPSEIKAVSPFKAELMLIKLKKEISVLLTDANIEVEMTCEKCLKKYKTKIIIPHSERQFYAKKPINEPDLGDIQQIDLQNMTIDLYEMIRQEIILHFPLISVCSKSCKGLCQKCGKDKNLEKCKCRQDNSDEYKPFKDLKKIISQ